jgi:LPS-assembly lipoprotein
MWSSDRRRLIATLAAAAALAGCGFSPALAPGGAGARLRGRIRADVPADTRGFDFVAALEERLGRPGASAYRLAYRIETTRVAAAISSAGVTTRNALTGQVAWELFDADGRLLAAGNARNFTGWSAAGSTTATDAAADDATRRLMRMLAEEVATALVARAEAEGWGSP